MFCGLFPAPPPRPPPHRLLHQDQWVISNGLCWKMRCCLWPDGRLCLVLIVMELNSAPCSTRKKGKGKKERHRKLLLFVPIGLVHSLSLCGKACSDFIPQTYFPEALSMGGDCLKYCFLLFISLNFISFYYLYLANSVLGTIFQRP